MSLTFYIFISMFLYSIGIYKFLYLFNIRNLYRLKFHKNDDNYYNTFSNYITISSIHLKLKKTFKQSWTNEVRYLIWILVKKIYIYIKVEKINLTMRILTQRLESN